MPLFKKSASALRLELDGNGLTLGGRTFYFPFIWVRLEDVLGRANFNDPGRGKGGAALCGWHAHGIYFEEDSADFVHRLFLQVQPGKVGPKLRKNFTGEVYVAGEALSLTGNEPVQTKWLEVRPLVSPDGAVRTLSVGERADLDERLNPKDYDHKTPDVEIAQFTDFNVKLAVLQHLMYEHRTVEPKFSIYDFIEIFDGRKISLSEDGYAIIPEAKAWFEALQIPLSALENITEIYQDAGDDVYAEIFPYWDGECNTFDITSAKDFALMPNLQKVSLIADERLRRAVEAQGIKFRIT